MSIYFPLPVASLLPWPPANRRAIEDQIELLIAMLDAVDGDPDKEDDNEDCCAAWDDCAHMFSHGRLGYDCQLQDPDAEPDSDDEQDDWFGGNVEDESQAAEGQDYYPHKPIYGIDQAIGMLNGALIAQRFQLSAQLAELDRDGSRSCLDSARQIRRAIQRIDQRQAAIEAANNMQQR